MARVLGLAGVAALCLQGVRADPATEKGTCQFANEPVFPGYFWDPTCKPGGLGCQADGKNLECRFCGGGAYTTPCPPSSCHFPNDPFVPYYWDRNCTLGMLGCWADGIHPQCRFCGMYPYTSIACPEGITAPPQGAACAFEEEPTTEFFWNPACKKGKHGCLADGVHEECSFCGGGAYADIPCPASEVCSFANEPTVPYFFDTTCAMGKLGCNADGVHVQCRFCAKRPFETIPCPEAVAPPKNVCTWPRQSEPKTSHYWEPACAMGKLGCWADGIHAECRFCGEGVFENITCPNSTSPSGAGAGASRGAASGATSRSSEVGGAMDVRPGGATVASSTELSATVHGFGSSLTVVTGFLFVAISRVLQFA